jgi:hypothetical protein
MTDLQPTSQTEQQDFDLCPHYDPQNNTFGIVHLNNENYTCHLTSTLLQNSALREDNCCFFYQILALSVEEFNKKYSSFAFLSIKKGEAYLYMNVAQNHFYNILVYLRSFDIKLRDFTGNNHYCMSKDEYDYYSNIMVGTMDLATLLGMPTLVSLVRDIISEYEKYNPTNIFDCEDK